MTTKVHGFAIALATIALRRDLSRLGAVHEQLSRYYCSAAGAKLLNAQAHSKTGGARQAEAPSR